MKYTIQTLKACFVGLITAQVLSTIQVYSSDLALYRTVQAALDAGYLGIPNNLVLPSLLQISSALAGGFFFTLSVGAGLTLLSWIGAWTWNRLFRRSGKALFLPVAVWLLLIIAVGENGFDLTALLYFIIIPPAVFITASISAKQGRKPEPGATKYLPAAGLLILVLTWLPLANHNLFINLRDYLLLANPVGTKINDAYYRYTLYPAQVFKNLEQKTIKTIYLDRIEKKPIRDSLIAEFRKSDYIPVSDPAVADLHVRWTSAGALLFQYGNRDILQLTPQDFMKQPAATMKKISGLTDRFVFFRLFTSFGVFIGFPVMLYILLHGLIYLAGRLALPPKQAFILATLAVFLAGLFLALPLYLGKMRGVDINDQKTALKSASWQERVSGLRSMAAAGKNPLGLLDIDTVTASPYIPERYWYVKAVGNSPETEPRDLFNFLDDASANVVCMAYEGLGKKGDPRVIDMILTRLKNEDHWYVQWYAYRALRRAGWHQGTEVK